MVATTSSTTGELELKIDDSKTLIAENVSCNLYGLNFIELKGAGRDGWELEIDIVEPQEIVQGVTYKINGLNQSSAAYLDTQGKRWGVQGELKFATFNLKGGIVVFNFELNTTDNEQTKKLRGKGDFFGINQYSKKNTALG